MFVKVSLIKKIKIAYEHFRRTRSRNIGIFKKILSKHPSYAILQKVHLRTFYDSVFSTSLYWALALVYQVP